MITDTKQHEIMDAFNKMIPYFKTFFEDDIMIGIYNTKNSLVYTTPDSMHSTYRVGDRVPEGSAAYAAIKEKKVIQKYVGKEVYGVPIKSIAIPLTDDMGQVIGSLDIGKSLKKQTEISDLSQEIQQSVSTITGNVDEVNEVFQDQAVALEEIMSSIEKLNETAKVLQNMANKL